MTVNCKNKGVVTVLTSFLVYLILAPLLDVFQRVYICGTSCDLNSYYYTNAMFYISIHFCFSCTYIYYTIVQLHLNSLHKHNFPGKPGRTR